MKLCPQCNRKYSDESLLYCLDDGGRLLDGPGTPLSEDRTRDLPGVSAEPATAIPGRTLQYQTPASRTARRNVPKLLIGTSLLLAAALAAGAYYVYQKSYPARSRKDARSIAVLPLTNLSGDVQQDYFADGMTEAVIGNLSRVASIKVISRTSVMKYKNSGKTVPEIANELGVNTIVEGSVQRSADRIRVTAQLIDAASDSPIWSGSFERSMSDILKLESEIAQGIAGEIRAQLTSAEQQRLNDMRTVDPRATEAYLLGRHYFNSSTREGERLSVENFQKAVEIEPNYADAWAGLSQAWIVRATLGEIAAHESEKPARDAAQKALEVDPQNSAAQVSNCLIYASYDFDWVASENACKRGIELDSNSSRARFAYAALLNRLERWDEMSEQMQAAIRLDPVEASLPSTYGAFLTQARRFEEAEKYLNHALEIDPGHRIIYFNLARLYNEQGRFDEALAVNDKKGFDLPLATALIYTRKGERQRAIEILDRSPKDNLYELALVYSALGDADKAFEVLNRSLDRGDGFMFGYATFLDLDRLKPDPRWSALMRRMNLPG